MTAPVFGLALGGGGARGLSHLGVLEVLHEEGLAPGALAGTSIGAVLGAAYALEPDPAALRRRILDYFGSPAYARHGALAMTGTEPGARRGILDRLRYSLKRAWLVGRFLTGFAAFSTLMHREFVAALVPEADFRDCAIPLSIPVLNMTTGRMEFRREGPLREAALASSALGGAFSPVFQCGAWYADPGGAAIVPADAARELGAAVVVGVDISAALPEGYGGRSGVLALARLNQVYSELLIVSQRAACDVLVSPQVNDIPWNDFTDLDRPAAAGRVAALAALPAIRAALAVRGDER